MVMIVASTFYSTKYVYQIRNLTLSEVLMKSKQTTNSTQKFILTTISRIIMTTIKCRIAREVVNKKWHENKIINSAWKSQQCLICSLTIQNILFWIIASVHAKQPRSRIPTEMYGISGGKQQMCGELVSLHLKYQRKNKESDSNFSDDQHQSCKNVNWREYF